MISMIIAEAALETVPAEIADHPAVRNQAARRGKAAEQTLLDMSYHYAAMKSLRNWERRGRPDITFVTLLNLLESPLNYEGHLAVYVHTLEDLVISMDPRVKLPRNYLRFVGLMEQLLEEGKIPPKGRPLMTVSRQSLGGLISRIGPSRTVALTERGKRVRLGEYCQQLAKESPAILIGGFQRGEFRKKDLDLAGERVSIYGKPLDAWIAASEMVHGFEQALGIL